MKAGIDAKTQRINALEQLVAVLRKQQEGMKRSLREKDARIAELEGYERAALAAAQNSEAI